MLVNNVRVKFNVDTGAAVTLINVQDTRRLLFTRDTEMFESNIQLISYCKSPIKFLGYISVEVNYLGQCFKLNLYLTDVQQQPLLVQRVTKTIH